VDTLLISIHFSNKIPDILPHFGDMFIRTWITFISENLMNGYSAVMHKPQTLSLLFNKKPTSANDRALNMPGFFHRMRNIDF